MFEHLKAKNRKLDYCKNPEKYDEYVCTLSPKYQEMAERQLGETEEVRTRCMQEMREWIADNPKIISCRTDAIFLLRFLRVCKFNVAAACKKLDNFLKVHEKYPKWFQNIHIDDDVIRSFFENEYLTLLPEKDKFGRQIWFFQTKNLDSKKYKSADIMRMTEFVAQMLFEDEEVQVAGIMGIWDDTGFNMGHVTMWGINDVREAVKFISRALPLRACGWHRVNFPPLGRAIYDFIKSLLPRKIQQRVQMFKTMDDVNTIINIDILPKEFNPDAKYSCKEINAEFIKAAETRKEEILQDEIMIKIKKYENKENKNFNEVNGNFRKLDVF